MSGEHIVVSDHAARPYGLMAWRVAQHSTAQHSTADEISVTMHSFDKTTQQSQTTQQIRAYCVRVIEVRPCHKATWPDDLAVVAIQGLLRGTVCCVTESITISSQLSITPALYIPANVKH